MNRTLLLALASLPLCACSPSGAAAPRSAAPNVILVCLDTVRADHLGCYGYRDNPTTPELDRLASEALRFADASAVAGWTKPSVPSFLTGTYPLQHGVYEGSARSEQGKVSDVLPPESLTLAEVFAARGYATAAFVENAQLKRGTGMEQGFGEYTDGAGDAREIRWRTQDWLEARDAQRPFFLYLHYLDAHWPYDVPAEDAARFSSPERIALFRGGDSRQLRDDVNDGARQLSGEELEALVDLYDGSLRYLDAQLGRLFEHLRQRGLWEDTLICVIADHGEEFLEHGRIGHGHGLYEGLLRVPFLLRVPGRGAAVVETPVSLVDVFPTLLSAAGVRELPASEGVDRWNQPHAARPLFAEHKEPGAYQQSLRSGTRKLVRRFTPGPASARGGAPDLRLGQRWEAELDAQPGAGSSAVRMNPRDAAGDDVLEIKGELEAVVDGALEVAGFRARFDARTELYGDVPAGLRGPAQLALGSGVKLVGALEGGELVARRIKLYASGERVEPEVRGSVTALEGSASAGRVQLSGVWVELGVRTEWGELEERAPALSREAIAELVRDLEPGGARSALRTSSCGYDLATDGRELAPADAPADLERGLDALGAGLSSRRIWGAQHRQVLGLDALDGLRALGYVR